MLNRYQYYCNVCQQYSKDFAPAGYKEKLFKRKKIVGGGVRKKCICPVCGSIDRIRWIYWVLENKTDIFANKREMSVLHFAPEKQIEERLRKSNDSNYVTADIEVGRADVVEDITALTFADNSFDYIICNHVMEHIPEEEKALNELKRCIKPSGKIILSVPICLGEKTYEDKSVNTSDKRLKYYGQADHVRLYGYDIQERFQKFGFSVEKVDVNSFVNKHDMKQMSLIEYDTVWLLSK